VLGHGIDQAAFGVVGWLVFVVEAGGEFFEETKSTEDRVLEKVLHRAVEVIGDRELASMDGHASACIGVSYADFTAQHCAW